MEDARHTFNEVRRLQADAVGEPGNRRFRLLVEDGHRAACLWLDKEQLQALGLAIDQQFSPLSVIWPRDSAEARCRSPTPCRSRSVRCPRSTRCTRAVSCTGT